MRRLVFLFLLVGCTDFTAPHGTPVGPLPIYDSWWTDLEHCTDIRADMGRIEWFQVNGAFDPGTGHEHHGMWTPPHRIHLALPDVEWLVKHEMLHDLTNGAGHDHPLFLKCDIAVRFIRESDNKQTGCCSQW